MCNCDDETDFDDLCEECLEYHDDLAKEMRREYRLYSGHDKEGNLIDVREPDKIIKYK